MLKFLHLGDLHLCSPLSILQARLAAEWREAQFAALEEMLAQAASRGAQMILMAGDVFDTPCPDKGGVDRFFSVVASQPLPVVVAPGNHDYWQRGGVWDRADRPMQLHVFESNSLSCFDLPSLQAAVYGYAFTGEGMDAPALGTAADLLPDRTAILLAHGDMTSPLSSYAPISGAQLERAGFAYAALGHIHNPLAQRRFGKTLAAYSGFFAGRGFDELGRGGALLVTVDGARVETERLYACARCFEEAELDCTGALSAEEIRARLRGLLEGGRYATKNALRVRLTGEVGLACRCEPAALNALGAVFALFEVKDETVPIFDAAYLEKDPTLRGAFYRALLPQLTGEDAEARAVAAEALRLGFAALSGREV